MNRRDKDSVGELKKRGCCMMKRCAMEFVGTFFLTVAISLIAHPVAIGLILMAMIYVGGHVSGAHFNPAVSLACFIQKRLEFENMAKYMLAQCLGAFVALIFFVKLTKSAFALEVVPEISFFGPMMIEALLVLVLAWVYLAMNVSSRYKDTAIPGVVIGLTLSAIAHAPGLFNPAVAVASCVMNASAQQGCFIIYVVGPLLGAIGASFIFDYFKPQI
jgi:aquaporin Z